ncbi:MAG: TatD family nuclease-associated radical SAM protein [Christensenellales bacterium]|jgi:TatD family-associated radical SAM protein
MNTFTYQIDDKIYVNLTNRCSNSCLFCIRNTCSGLSGYYLWLDREPAPEEVINELKDLAGVKEVVFCGFGEPLIRWREVVEIATFVKSRNVPVRVNTNGQANLFSGADIVPELAKCVDKISISLNEVAEDDYVNICNPEHGKAAYKSMLEFAARCKELIGDVTLSVVDIIGGDKIKKAQEIADNLGVKLRVRKYCSG